MSPTEHFLLTISLILNGFWIGAQVIKWTEGSSRRLGLTMLAFFGASLLLFGPVVVIASQNAVTHLLKALSTILLAAGMWCFGDWARLQPAPWGQGPRRKKTRIR